MLTGLAHLALEVKFLDRAQAFYTDTLGLAPVEKGASNREVDTGGAPSREVDTEVAFSVGDTTLVLRRPTAVPRGGLHVHYAFTAPVHTYDDWLTRLGHLAPEEHQFGSYRSLYVDDPDDHCVEIGGVGESDDTVDGDATGDTGGTPPLTGIFEIVLEVGDLAAAEARYTALGFEVVDRGDDRHRVRLAGPFDLELWEPQLGLADARGGVHVDLGLWTDDPEAAVTALGDDVVTRESVDGGVRVREADGHWLTFLQN